MKFAHNAKQRGVEYPSVDNKVTQRVFKRLETWTDWWWIMIYSGKIQNHIWVEMYFKACLTCEKLPIQLYRIITLVKLPGYVPCAAFPLWNKNHFFTLRSSHFYSRKSLPKGSYAGVTRWSCAVRWTGWGGYAAALPSACAVHQQDAAAPANLRTADSAFSLAMLAGLLCLESP